MPSFLIFLGGKKPKIISDNHKFLDSLQKLRPNTKIIVVKGKKHVGIPKES